MLLTFRTIYGSELLSLKTKQDGTRKGKRLHYVKQTRRDGCSLVSKMLWTKWIQLELPVWLQQSQPRRITFAYFMECIVLYMETDRVHASRLLCKLVMFLLLLCEFRWRFYALLKSRVAMQYGWNKEYPWGYVMNIWFYRLFVLSNELHLQRLKYFVVILLNICIYNTD